jgi:hypothetical protein
VGADDGVFLVSTRANAEKVFVISVMFRAKPTHHLAELKTDFFHLNGQETPASTLPEV